MKLKDGFILHDVGGEHMAVATGKAGEVFHGLVRNNGTADFIFRRLMEDVTEEALVSAVIDAYEAEPDRVAADVHRIVTQLREAGFLDE